MNMVRGVCQALIVWCTVWGCGGAVAADAETVLTVRIGDGLSQLGAKVQGLDPDVCSRSEKSWYQSNGWSCEGYVKEGLKAGDIELKARIRMVEPAFTVGNVTMSGVVDEVKSAGAGAVLVKACDGLMSSLESRYGRGEASTMNKTAGAVHYVVFYESEAMRCSATLVCQENGNQGKAEVLVSIDRAGQKVRAREMLALK